MIVVSNSTPLITLAKVGHFDLLKQLFTEITISDEVWDEVVIKGAGQSGASETSQADWIKVSPIANPALIEEWKIAHGLGAGEVSTILLAKRLSAKLALIDERKARALAVREGLAVSGSVAILENGYRKKHVSDLREVYAQLLASGVWIDQRKLNQSLARFDISPL